MGRVLLFDLDGTLTESAPGIISSIIYTLEYFDLPVPPREKMFNYIGPTLTESFLQLCGFDSDKAAEAVGVYRQYLSEKGMYENSVYDGIPALLDRLHGAGYRLGVATSKQEGISRRILEHFGLIDRFEFVAGSTMDESRSSKEDVIRWAMENMNVADPQDVYMIGDTKYDINGAKAAGVRSIGVLYGYGTEAELREAGADHICPTVASVGELLA